MLKLDSTTRTLLRDPGKRRGWIIYQLTLQGRSLADVARASGVRRQTLYQVFVRPYPRMEKLIADALGVAPPELWPERYDADGLPNRQRGRPAFNKTKNNTVTSAKNTKRGGAGNVNARRVA